MTCRPASVALLAIALGALSGRAAGAHQSFAAAFDATINPEFAEATAQLADFFLDRYVINPRTYPAFGAGRGGRGGRP
jgi:hypothetical protein